MSLADPIWASGNAPASTGRTHDRIRAKANISQTYLNPTGRPHMVLRTRLQLVLAKEQGEWRIVAFHNVAVAPLPNL
jgi:hypothetical protein